MTTQRSRTQPPPGPDFIYYSIRWFFGRLMRLLTHYEVIGLENIPPDGAFIFTTNHMSFFDSVVVFINMPRRMVALGADKWRKAPFFKQILELTGVIWVARGEADVDAMKAALAHLKAGGRLGLAPEGTRSKDAQLHPGKAGTAYLASRARVLIVPSGITGTEHVLSSLKRLRRPHVRCVIGKPYYLPGSPRAKGAELDALTDEVMCQIAALLPPPYHGAYAEHPRLKALLGENQPVAPPVSA